MEKRQFTKIKKEDGEIMLESILVMIPTLFVLIFLLSLGFLLYQKWNIQYVADDIASKIATSFEYLDEDVPTTVVSLEDAQEVLLYKYLFNLDDYEELNNTKANNYGSHLLQLTGYGNGVGGETIQLTVEEDSLARRHIRVVITGTYRIPFAEGLEVFGMDGTRTFTAVSYAECIDMTDYMNTVVFGDQVGEILFGNSKSLKMINTWIGVFKKIFD